jgi:hypothetical protein
VTRAQLTSTLAKPRSATSTKGYGEKSRASRPRISVNASHTTGIAGVRATTSRVTSPRGPIRHHASTAITGTSLWVRKSAAAALPSYLVIGSRATITTTKVTVIISTLVR